jgi:hypothetical protein
MPPGIDDMRGARDYCTILYSTYKLWGKLRPCSAPRGQVLRDEPLQALFFFYDTTDKEVFSTSTER